MTTDIQKANAATYSEILERVIILGDLKRLSPEERLTYYAKVCESLGLNPLTRPFEYITLNGKEVLYARRDATDQLRRIHNVSVEITSREQVGEVYVVTAKARMGDRVDESIGAVSLAGLKGDALANAYMKAETKAKRRVTLSICGLGFLDETEVETIPGAQVASPAQSSPTPLVENNGNGESKQNEGKEAKVVKMTNETKNSPARDRLIEVGKRGRDFEEKHGKDISQEKAAILSAYLSCARDALRNNANDETLETIAKDIEAVIELGLEEIAARNGNARE